MQRSIAPWLAFLWLVIGIEAAWSKGTPQPSKKSGTTVLRGDDLPYAYRASALLNRIASVSSRSGEDAPGLESLLSTLGLNPSTEAAKGLVRLALELDRTHPYVVPEEELAAFGRDYDAISAYLDRRESLRLEALGEGLGLWLRDREAAQLPVDPLLDRLLNGSHLSVSLFSTDETEAELRESTRLKIEGFERGLTRTFGRVPSRLEWKP